MRLSSQDLRLAVRSFARQRGFTVVAVLSLALAISLNTTMYSVIDAMVRPKLAMQDPDRLYSIRLWGDVRRRVDAATIDAIVRSGNKTVEAVTYSAGDFNERAVELGDQYAFASSAIVALNYFRVLGVTPVRGRVFGDADVYAAPQPVLISDRLAEKLSPRAPLPLGTVIQIDGESHPVIGVLGKGMDFSSAGGQIWRLPKPGPELAARVPTLVRIREDASIEDAVAEFTLFSNRIAQLAGEAPRDVRFELKRVNKPQFQFLNFHYALIAAVIAVLLVACANIANLQLARGIARGRELALRTALGASRRQLIEQMLLESALLATAGLALGLVLTFWGSHMLATRIPPSVAEYVIAPQITWRVFAFAIVAGVLCTILIGLVPAIRVSRVDPNQMLKSGAGTGSNRRNRRQYAAMVVAEIGLSLALLCGAALVVRTALRVAAIDIGYDPKPLSTALLAFRPARDSTVPIYSFFAQSAARVRAIPGVGEIGVSITRRYVKYTITVDERGGAPREVMAPGAIYQAVSPGYLRTYRRPIVKGRDFLDGIPSEPEVIVDQQSARALWPGVDPIGMQIKMGEYKSDAPWVRVVGVVRDRTERSLKTYEVPTSMRRDVGEIFYLPAGDETATVSRGTSVSFVVRATSEPERIPVALRRELSKTPGAIYAAAASMEEALGIVRQRLRHDFIASLFSLFALMAIGLAALGIHGIVAHSVAERTRELGVRIALGATSRNILHVVLREGNAVALAGVAVGLYLTKRTAGWLQAFTFENDRYDAPLFAAMGLLLFGVAVLSALLPALRATRVDPVESLRSE